MICRNKKGIFLDEAIGYFYIYELGNYYTAAVFGPQVVILSTLGHMKGKSESNNNSQSRQW